MKKLDAIVGHDPERAGEENYFYVRLGSDASIVVQAAVDYVATLQNWDDMTWKEKVDWIYSTPRSRKYKYHKDHPKHLHEEDTSFAEWFRGLHRKANKNG